MKSGLSLVLRVHKRYAVKPDDPWWSQLEPGMQSLLLADERITQAEEARERMLGR